MQLCADKVELVQMGLKLSTIFICFATCADKVELVQMGLKLSTVFICYATCGCNIQITMATKLFRPITTDHGMPGGDTAYNNILKVHLSGVYRASWKVELNSLVPGSSQALAFIQYVTKFL